MKDATRRTKEWRRKNPEKWRAQSQRYYERHKDEIKERQRAWGRRNKQKMKRYFRNRDLMKRYGITLADFEAMLSEQDGCCAICNKVMEPREAHLDHDHNTGAVRGILCSTCNTGLGMFQENVAHLAAAAAYIDRHRAGPNVADVAQPAANVVDSQQFPPPNCDGLSVHVVVGPTTNVVDSTRHPMMAEALRQWDERDASWV